MKLNLGCGRYYLPDYLNADLFGGEITVDSCRLPFKNDIFDEVLASHVLEHIPNLIAAIHEIHRVLKFGGLLKVIVPLGLQSLYGAGHLHAFNFRDTLQGFCLTPKDDLETETLFRMVEKRITNWRIPFRYHIHKYVPFLRLTWRNRYGRVKTRLPLGPRDEATFLMEAR